MGAYKVSMFFCIVGSFCSLQAEDKNKQLPDPSPPLKEKTSYHASVSANYLYWKLSEDIPSIGDLVTSDDFIPTGTEDIPDFFNGENASISLNPGYKSGFQVGGGYDVQGLDAWNLLAGYTWYQNTNKTTTNAASNQLITISSIFRPLKYEGRILFADSLSSSLDFNYNSFFLALQKKLSVKNWKIDAGMGLRALWIAQKLHLTVPSLSYVFPYTSVYSLDIGSLNLEEKQNCWGLGPQFIMNASWILPYSLKIMGNLGLSVPYTRYTNITSSAETLESIASASSDSYGTLRAIAEASLGLGWDLCFGIKSHAYRLGLAASYDFNVFWNFTEIGQLATSANIYLQGLNIKVDVDF